MVKTNINIILTGTIILISILFLAGCAKSDLAGEAYKGKGEESGLSKELTDLFNKVGVKNLEELYDKYKIEKREGRCNIGQALSIIVEYTINNYLNPTELTQREEITIRRDMRNALPHGCEILIEGTEGYSTGTKNKADQNEKR